MTPTLLALSLAAAPELWAATQGFDAMTCDAGSLAAAIQAHRPGSRVHPWHPESGVESPPSGDVRVQLTRKAGSVVLEVTGAGTPLTRTLPAGDDCTRTVELAALIVDGALDDLKASEAAPRVDSVAPPVPLSARMGAGVALGAGFEQSATGFAAALDAQGTFRYRLLELTLDLDVGLPSSSTVIPGFPETVQGAVTGAVTGTVTVTSLTAELGVGLAPHLGPGRLSADALLGVSFAFASTTPSTALFQRTSATAADAFAGLRLGYVFDLPRGFFAGARAEERLAPVQADFTPVGTSPTVSTPAFTFQALALVGYRFL